MRFVFGIAAGVTVLSLSAAASALVSGIVTGRSGMERVQAEAGTGVPGSGTERRAKAGPKRHHSRPSPSERHNEDNGGAGPNVNPPPDAMEPPGCIYRKEPLGLIV
jgi:hypothetical protein